MSGKMRARPFFGAVFLVVMLLASCIVAVPIPAEKTEATPSPPICGFPIYKQIHDSRPHTGSRYLAATGDHAYIYVDSGNPSQDEIDHLLDEFDHRIWASNTQVFGTIVLDRINIHLAAMDGPGGLGGYYYPGTWDIYIDAADLSFWGDEIAAHEFQHLIHDKHDSDEDLWVNEGMADMAIHLLYGPNSFAVSGHLDSYESTPDNDLTLFENQMYDYGSAYAFMLWVWEHFGGNDTLRTIVNDQMNGFDGINDALRSIDIKYSYSDVALFSMWSVANILDDTNVYGGLYGYYSVDISMALEGSYDNYPASQTSDVNNWANDYYSFKNGDRKDLVIHAGRIDASVNYTLIGIGPGDVMIQSAYVTPYNPQQDLTVPGFGSTHPQVYLAVSGITGGRYSFSVEMKDNTPPVTTMAISPQTPDGLNGYYISKPTIGFATSEPATTYFHWDNDTDTKYCQSCTPPAIPLAPEGEHILHYHSVDPEGNVELVEKFALIKVDSERPQTFLTLDPLRPDGDQGWYVHKVTAALNMSEPGSIFYRWDSGFFHNYTEPMIVEEGEHTLFYNSKDLAGNEGETHSMEVKVDTLPPVAYCEIYPAIPDGASGFYITQPTVALSSPEPDITLMYTVDSSNVQFRYQQPFKVPDGTHTIGYWAFDKAGNTIDVQTRDFKVDITPPTSKISSMPESPDGLNGWFVTQPTVKIATDKDATAYYSIDDGPQKRYAGSFQLDEGKHKIRYYSKDRAGNIETAKTLDIKFDITPPTTKAKVDGFETNGWYLDAPTVTFQAESGAATYYSWDDVDYTKYVVPIKAREGRHDMSYYSIDEAGNKGPQKALSFAVDTVDPNAYFFATPLNAFVGDEIIFDATNASDNIKIESYSLDMSDGNIEDLRGEPVINHIYNVQGTYKVTLTVTDTAGRKASFSRDVVVEKRPKKEQEFTSILESPLMLFFGLLIILAIAGVGVYRYRKRKQLEEAVAAYEAFMAQKARAKRGKPTMRKGAVRKAPSLKK